MARKKQTFDEAMERLEEIVEQLEHRAGKDAEGKTGDGVGILTQISHPFFKRCSHFNPSPFLHIFGFIKTGF